MWWSAGKSWALRFTDTTVTRSTLLHTLRFMHHVFYMQNCLHSKFKNTYSFENLPKSLAPLYQSLLHKRAMGIILSSPRTTVPKGSVTALTVQWWLTATALTCWQPLSHYSTLDLGELKRSSLWQLIYFTDSHEFNQMEGANERAVFESSVKIHPLYWMYCISPVSNITFCWSLVMLDG